jgi:hypothetical protein
MSLTEKILNQQLSGSVVYLRNDYEGLVVKLHPNGKRLIKTRDGRTYESVPGSKLVTDIVLDKVDTKIITEEEYENY